MLTYCLLLFLPLEQAVEQRTRFHNAWVNDNTRIEKQSNNLARAKLLWADMRQIIKRVPAPELKLGPLTDVVHIVLGIQGLAEAISTNNVKGIVKSSVGIIGATVALGLFAAGSAGVALAAQVAPVVGLLFYIAGMLIEAFWPSNTAIETANKLSSYARQEINGFSPQLQQMSQEGRGLVIVTLLCHVSYRVLQSYNIIIGLRYMRFK